MWRHIQYLQFKRIWRSQRMGSGIAARIFMGFFIVYFGLLFLAMGVFFTEIAEESGLEGNPILILHKYFFYYLLIELIMRVIFQEVSEVSFRQMAVLPVKKAKVIRYILSGTVVSIFNLLPLLFLVPVAISTLYPAYGMTGTISWVLAAFCLLLFNNFLALQLKHVVSGNPLFYVAIVGVIGILYLVDTMGYMPLSTWFHEAMTTVLQLGLPALIFAGLAYAMYHVVFHRMKGQAYVSNAAEGSASVLEKLDFSGIGESGFSGIVTELNLQLMFRNKRIRTQIIFGALFLLYGLFLYSGDRYGL